jgi:hypothetical protein
MVEHHFPNIGNPIPCYTNNKRAKAEGHILILWTYRSGEELNEAVKYCKLNKIKFHAINNNSF